MTNVVSTGRSYPSTVYVLTWCRSPELLYGSLLVFETLRLGFPNARVVVADNASPAWAQDAIGEKALASGAEFFPLEREIRHAAFLCDVVLFGNDNSAVFVDPDVCFWENVEGWSFDGLMAGRLLPRHREDLTGCVVEPRLHTSFLWFPDLPALRAEVTRLRGRYFEFDPFLPVMFPLGGEWRRFDTGGVLYAALKAHARPFEERHLDAYDHLFCGSHLPMIAPRLPHGIAEEFLELHERVRSDYRALRGAWRRQEEYFQQCAKGVAAGAAESQKGVATSPAGPTSSRTR